MHIAVNSGSGITQAQYLEAIRAVSSVYTPIVSALGANLNIASDWSDEEVNAYANQKRNNWNVVVSGGLARYPNMTEDAIKVAICHEVGHHVGGYPSFSDAPTMSVEGEADYFAALKCARRVFANDQNVNIVQALNPPAAVTMACAKQFNDAEAQALCARTEVAALTLALMMHDLSQDPFPTPRFDNPSKRQVEWMMESHPLPQCRLDTFVNGSLCQTSVDVDLSSGDPIIGACSEENHETIGIRPRCWYSPQGAESPQNSSMPDGINPRVPFSSSSTKRY